MIREEDLIFVTTTLYTKWFDYQQRILKKNFPNSQYLVIDGRGNWPNSWFNWIKPVQKMVGKYFIHLDEDFFLTSKEELIKSIEWMVDNKYDVVGCSDGLHHYRGANPIAINTFLMIGKIEVLEPIVQLDLEIQKYWPLQKGSSWSWCNTSNIKFDPNWNNNFTYPHKVMGGYNFDVEQEPYYAFLWSLMSQGFNFGYLYPHFDEYYKSTNPRVNENSLDIGVHMWYTRQWNSNMDVHGLPNIERYQRIEKFIIENG